MDSEELDRREWYIQIGSEPRGPLSGAALQALWESGLLNLIPLFAKGWKASGSCSKRCSALRQHDIAAAKERNNRGMLLDGELDPKECRIDW